MKNGFKVIRSNAPIDDPEKFEAEFFQKKVTALKFKEEESRIWKHVKAYELNLVTEEWDEIR